MRELAPQLTACVQRKNDGKCLKKKNQRILFFLNTRGDKRKSPKHSGRS